MLQRIVSLADFPKEGMVLSGDVRITAESLPGDAVAGVRRLHVEARLFKLGDTFHMDGTLEADLELACGRCLEPFSYQDRIGIRHCLQPEGRELGPDAFAYAEESFDLEAMVRELVDVNLPMKPLCTEACKGLCPSCGANWNRGACQCRPEPEGPLAEALRKLTQGE
jgi:uncharacterized protein